MKYIYILLIVSMAGLFGACKNSDHHEDVKSDSAKNVDTMKMDSINPGVKRFEVEKGVAVIKSYYSKELIISRTLYFDRYGARLLMVDERGFFTYEMNGFHYELNGKEKKTVKEKLRLESNYDPQMLNAMLMSDEVKKEINWTAGGEEEILGKKCQKYSCHHLQLRFTTDVWLYKGFPIRVQNTDPAKNVSITECTSFQENVAMDANRFELPDWAKK